MATPAAADVATTAPAVQQPLAAGEELEAAAQQVRELEQRAAEVHMQAQRLNKEGRFAGAALHRYTPWANAHKRERCCARGGGGGEGRGAGLAAAETHGHSLAMAHACAFNAHMLRRHAQAASSKWCVPCVMSFQRLACRVPPTAPPQAFHAYKSPACAVAAAFCMLNAMPWQGI